MSLKMTFALAVMLAVGSRFASADVVELKDKAAVTGKVLAEKRDAIVVDVGYTVLVIPRSAVAKISVGEIAATAVSKSAEAKTPAAAKNTTPELKQISDCGIL